MLNKSKLFNVSGKVACLKEKEKTKTAENEIAVMRWALNRVINKCYVPVTKIYVVSGAWGIYSVKTCMILELNKSKKKLYNYGRS